jgi:hypothetical protein
MLPGERVHQHALIHLIVVRGNVGAGPPPPPKIIPLTSSHPTSSSHPIESFTTRRSVCGVNSFLAWCSWSKQRPENNSIYRALAEDQAAIRRSDLPSAVHDPD